jgi:ATP-dependent DNA ligase
MASLKFIEPMYARAVEKLPEGRDWLYEIKLDGYRCLAGRDSRGVNLWSRRANIFTTRFPRIARGFEKLQPDILINGEIVAIDVTEKELESISESACEKITESQLTR